MTSINVTALTRQLYQNRDDPVSRVHVAPRLENIREISRGPTASGLSESPFSTIPSELARTLGLYYDFGDDRTDNRHVISRIPVQFTLNEDKGKHVAVFVQSIDTNVDYTLYPQYFFKARRPNERSDKQIKIEGLYVELDEYHKIGKKKLKDRPFKRCVIAYDLDYQKGNFADVCEGEDLPSTQVIKSLDVLHQAINKHFVGGFIESFNPKKETTWGYVAPSTHSCPDWITVGALKESVGAWKFNRPRRSEYALWLVGVTVPAPGTYAELSGDTVLTSDGTILHSYYFSRTETIMATEKSGIQPRKIPDTWQDGYYFNRFYPPGSLRVPQGVVESFSKEMPEYFRNTLLLERELA